MKNNKKTKKVYFNKSKNSKIKKNLVKKILIGSGISVASTSAIIFATLSIINKLNNDNIDNKDIKLPIVTPPEPTPNPPLESVFANYTKQELEDSSFALKFLWQKLLDDVNHNNQILSSTAKFVSFKDKLNYLEKDIEFIIEDNGKYYLVSYVNRSDAFFELNDDFANPSTNLSDLTYNLYDSFSLNYLDELNKIDNSFSEQLSKYIKNFENINVISFLGSSKSYNSSTVFKSENECVDLYGYTSTNNIYKEFKITFGRLASNYYDSTIEEDIANFVKEYNSYDNITKDQLNELKNKYSISCNLSSDSFEEQSPMAKLLLLIQEYDENNKENSLQEELDELLSNLAENNNENLSK